MSDGFVDFVLPIIAAITLGVLMLSFIGFMSNVSREQTASEYRLDCVGLTGDPDSFFVQSGWDDFCSDNGELIPVRIVNEKLYKIGNEEGVV